MSMYSDAVRRKIFRDRFALFPHRCFLCTCAYIFGCDIRLLLTQNHCYKVHSTDRWQRQNTSPYKCILYRKKFQIKIVDGMPGTYGGKYKGDSRLGRTTV
jgi:hypothetical protein